MTILPPLLRRKRRALTGGGPRDDLRDIAVFAAFRSFYALETPIVQKTKERF
jgi:hypothetical protein